MCRLFGETAHCLRNRRKKLENEVDIYWKDESSVCIDRYPARRASQHTRECNKPMEKDCRFAEGRKGKFYLHEKRTVYA